MARRLAWVKCVGWVRVIHLPYLLHLPDLPYLPYWTASCRRLASPG